MAKIVVGLFDDMESAQAAQRALQEQGFARNNIDLRSGEKLMGQLGAERADDENDGFWASIKHFFSGFGEDERGADDEFYGVSETDALITVHADDASAQRAADILDECGAADISERMSSEATSSTRESTAAPSLGESHRGAPTSAASSEQKIPIVEEQLKVGKRTASTGGVRVYSRIVERPVEADVTLREERVQVQRQPTDRPLSAGDGAFEEQSFEVREISEEPVVEKRARVKEEVSVKKESRQRTEKVRDTVRSTDVQIEQLNPEQQREFANYESEFQSEWQAKYARNSGLKYDDVLPGYQYGYRLGREGQYSDDDWSSIEPRVKSDWDKRGYGPWDRFKDAVRSGWERSHRH